MGPHEIRIEAAFLAASSVEAAYGWLETHRDNEAPSFFGLDGGVAVCEYLLLRRKEPLIDLGIARFGRSERAIRTVFRRGNIGVRCGALSNPLTAVRELVQRGWMEEQDLAGVIQHSRQAELAALASNPNLPNSLLVAMLNRSGAFEALPDSAYSVLLCTLGTNPRMSRPYGEEVLDGFADYDYHRVFSAAWELAQTLPNEPAWAFVLNKLLAQAHPPVRLGDIDNTIARWRIEPAGERAALSSSFWLRSRIADLMPPNSELFESPDKAVRLSAYRRFDPKAVPDWPRHMISDGQDFFEAAVENDRLWRTEEDRERLSELAWEFPDPNSSMNLPNIYRAVYSRKAREHPEWFD